MDKCAVKGSWVEIENTIFKPEDRSPSLPEDTKLKEYKQWTRGYLETNTASLGETVAIKTLINRIVSGKLTEINPRHKHDFGETTIELMDIGIELKREMESL